MSGISAVEMTKLVSERSEEVCAALEALDLGELDAPTALPGWSRLTIACHLRYGAQACRQMTEAALAGRPSAFYPGGRELQRPYTLRPALGESALHVMESLREECLSLAGLWAGLDEGDWGIVAYEHEETRSLGDPTLRELGLLRLTEVQIHGDDLQVGLGPWPAAFGRAVLPQRVARLRLDTEQLPDGVWLLSASDLGDHLVPPRAQGPPDVRFRATANDLVALLTGREPTGPIAVDGDPDMAAAFLGAIVGP